jgi:hypothetical protein
MVENQNMPLTQKKKKKKTLELIYAWSGEPKWIPSLNV